MSSEPSLDLSFVPVETGVHQRRTTGQNNFDDCESVQFHCNSYRMIMKNSFSEGSRRQYVCPVDPGLGGAAEGM